MVQELSLQPAKLIQHDFLYKREITLFHYLLLLSMNGRYV